MFVFASSLFHFEFCGFDFLFDELAEIYERARGHIVVTDIIRERRAAIYIYAVLAERHSFHPIVGEFLRIRLFAVLLHCLHGKFVVVESEMPLVRVALDEFFPLAFPRERDIHDDRRRHKEHGNAAQREYEPLVECEKQHQSPDKQKAHEDVFFDADELLEIIERTGVIIFCADIYGRFEHFFTDQESFRVG